MPAVIRYLLLAITFTIAVAWLIAPGLRAQQAEEAPAVTRVVPASAAQMQLSFAPLVKQTRPAVVNVFTKTVVTQRRSMFDELFGNDPFFNSPRARPRQRVENSLGSGVILRADGLVVTNAHVIRGATEIQVVTSDRREFDADVLFEDEESDLAFLQLRGDVPPLPVLELADSDALEVGDLVIAIGNPFGVGQTVTSGIISALERSSVSRSGTRFFIQTDAAINPGNSGGALVDMSGRLTGINTAIFSRSGGSNGIGFAIPSNLVTAFLRQVENGGRPVRPWIGLEGQTIDSDLALGLGLDRQGGIVVTDTFPGGPADLAALEAGDVILAVNGAEILDLASFDYRLRVSGMEAPLRLDVVRDGTPVELYVNATVPPEEPPREEALMRGDTPLGGAALWNISPAVAVELDLPGQTSGVVIADIRRNSPAARFGFRPGDVIVRINGERIGTTAQAQALLDSLADRFSRRRWSIDLRRGGRVTSFQFVY